MDKKIYWANIFILAFMATASIESTFLARLMWTFPYDTFDMVYIEIGIFYNLYITFFYFDRLIKPLLIVVMFYFSISNILRNGKYINLYQHSLIAGVILFYSIYSWQYFNVSSDSMLRDFMRE